MKRVMRRRRGAALALLASLAGCALGPNFKAPRPDLPASWTTATPPSTPSPLEADWWSSFHDPELQSLITRAVASNLDVRMAVLRVEQAQADRRIAAAGGWPQVSANAAVADTRISERTSTSSLLSAAAGHASGAAPGGVAGGLPGLTNPFTQYQYGLGASWQLDLFGRVRRGVEAAQARAEAANEDSRGVRVALMAEVAATYVDLRAVQARLSITRQMADTAAAERRLSAEAQTQGLGNDMDLSRASATRASAEAELPPLERQAALDRSLLARLIALPPGALDAELSQAPTARLAPPGAIPVGLPSDLARRRPDIRRAEDELHAAVAQQGVAVADLFPAVSLNAGLGYEASNSADLTNWAAHYSLISPSLDLPLFDAGRRRATVRIAQLGARSAALAYAQTVLSALHEADDALRVYGDDVRRQSALSAATDHTANALALAARRYRAGLASYREWLAAQTGDQTARLAQVAADAAVVQDMIVVYRVLGGGWDSFERH